MDLKCETSGHLTCSTRIEYFVGIKKRALYVGLPFSVGLNYCSVPPAARPALSAFPVNNPTREFCPSAIRTVTTGRNPPASNEREEGGGAYQTLSS